MIKEHPVIPGEIHEFIITGDSDADEIVQTISAKYSSISKGVLWNLLDGTNHPPHLK